MSDVVLTWLLNSVPDPQRRTTLPGDVSVLKVLRDSVAAHDRHLVVLHDCLDEHDGQLTTFVRRPPGGNPYWYRWRLTADYLADHPEIERVWCVDGTDVEMLHDPFPHMQPGALYVGSEPSSLSGPAGPWLRQHGASARKFIDDNPHLGVVNVGIIGGDRATVLDVAERLADLESTGDDYEMGAFQQLIHTEYPDHITGPMVHTVFRAHDRTAAAWWRHK